MDAEEELVIIGSGTFRAKRVALGIVNVCRVNSHIEICCYGFVGFATKLVCRLRAILSSFHQLCLV